MKGSPDNVGGNAYNEEIADKSKHNAFLLSVNAPIGAYDLHIGSFIPEEPEYDIDVMKRESILHLHRCSGAPM